MKSVYQMLRVEETERVEDIFCRMDSDADGVVTLQAGIFLQNKNIVGSLEKIWISCKNIHPCAGIHRFLFEGLQIVETFNTKYECD